ncbi:hypothetical protein Sme01_34950 [Sphaerisporangium melleum]|uniref:Uncharacterized protein n=1 Tax=Sphaerisporangium melleum TaxID=321316 RepID=A0A917VMR2_9ACTN|nr:hypothetical protein GCM10007964_43600 [Sphaerisporangium melleum]GII71019.1 hypothetical protein Sme01_34950 [Sphaerisporangium melleum]
MPRYVMERKEIRQVRLRTRMLRALFRILRLRPGPEGFNTRRGRLDGSAGSRGPPIPGFPSPGLTRG